MDDQIERQSHVETTALQIVQKQRISCLRAVAILAYYAIAQWLPESPMPGGVMAARIRLYLARHIFKKIGDGVRIHKGVFFGSGCNIEIGNNSAISKDSWVANDTVIGNDVMMAPEVIILSSSHSHDEVDRPMRLQGAESPKPVVIGDDVWIGVRAIILPGTKVGSHSIVGAGSVVTKDVPEKVIVAGNPAKIIRSR